MEIPENLLQLFTPLAISLGVGLLIGLQRSHSGSRLGGVRTFPLVALFGTICGLVSAQIGGWVTAAGLISVVTAMTAANFMILKQEGERGVGLTSEISMLLLFVLGAYAAFGDPWVVLAVGAAVAILLYVKSGLHNIVDRIGDKDMRAIMLFVAITFIIFPVLPNEAYGPYDAWNPRIIWLVVVLVVGISLGGYIAYKVLGGRGGTLAAGIIGGVISSTATTVSYARASGQERGLARPALLVIAVATCMSYARVFVEIGIVAPGLLRDAAFPIGAMALVGIGGALLVWFAGNGHPRDFPEPQNPTQLSSALLFAVLFALILLGVEAARSHLGSQGVYAASAIAGLVNLDAITLTNARIARTDEGMSQTVVNAIVLAIVANLAFKIGVVAVLGTRALLGRVALALGAQIAAGIAMIWLWPR